MALLPDLLIRFQSLGTAYYRGSDGVMFVFDLTSRESFEKLDHWIQEYQTHAPDTEPAVLCGNKSDLSKERQVSFEVIHPNPTFPLCMVHFLSHPPCSLSVF